MSWQRSQRRMFMLMASLMSLACLAAVLFQRPNVDPLDVWALPLLAALLMVLQLLLATRRIRLSMAFQAAYLGGAGYLLLALNHQFSVMTPTSTTLTENTYWFAVLFAAAFLAFPTRPATVISVSILSLAAAICALHLPGVVGSRVRLTGSAIQFLLTGAVLVVLHATIWVQYGRLMATRIAAYTDVLTGLANRRAAEEHLATLAQEHGRFTIVLFDLDHFKVVNDRYGHATGDLVLRGVGSSARRLVPPGGLAARWGGEEFLLILPQLSGQNVQAVLENLREELRLQSHGDVSGVTASFGVAMADPGEHPDQVLERADRAMYSAKAQGRNDIRVAEGRAVAEPGHAGTAAQTSVSGADSVATT